MPNTRALISVKGT